MWTFQHPNTDGFKYSWYELLDQLLERQAPYAIGALVSVSVSRPTEVLLFDLLWIEAGNRLSACFPKLEIGFPLVFPRLEIGFSPER